ncbi:MAG: 50S ribosomal protein L29 [Alphaproteobacteria bacterium]|tara:strand:- start:1386 stop:1589 length:204 start_codon:yes stop_codon:yes gene_type:complete
MEKFSDLVKLDTKTLKEKVGLLRKESLNLRFQKSSGQLEKTARINIVRKQIARLKTALNILKEKEKS